MTNKGTLSPAIRSFLLFPIATMISIDPMISLNSSKRKDIATSHQPVQPSSEAPTQSVQPVQTQSEIESVGSGGSAWLTALAYPLARYLLLPFYFRRIEVSGRENVPQTGAVILAPTHRSRWDAFMVPYAVGQDVTGRTLRFMVTADEVKGLQGWFIRRLGGFPIDTRRPAIATLRHSMTLLQHGEALVIFPEGNVFRECKPLKPGLARLALQAEASQPDLDVQIVPIDIRYSKPLVPWRTAVKIHVHPPIRVAEYSSENPKQSAKRLTHDLEQVFRSVCDVMRQGIH